MKTKILFFLLLASSVIKAQTYFSSQKIISDNATEAYRVNVADYDQDGKLDIVAALKNNIDIYTNLGDDNFISYTYLSDSGAMSLTSPDLNLDGYPDLLVSLYDENKITWHKNHNGRITNEKIYLWPRASGAYSSFAAKMDDDIYPDIISATNGNHLIRCFYSYGTGWYTKGYIVGKVKEVCSVCPVDFNADGNIDVLAAGWDNEIAWFINSGTMGVFKKKTISINETNLLTSICTADLDGDGDEDIISTSFNDKKLAWYENKGEGTFSAQKIISTDVGGAFYARCADVDDDGKIDIIVAAYLDNSIYWFKNQGNGNFTKITITNQTAEATSVCIADLDNDGDLDILSSSKADNKIAWYENFTLEILQQPQNYDACPNEMVRFSVTAKDAETYQWYVSTNGGVSFSKLSDDENYFGVVAPILTVKHALKSMDNYIYTCRVSNQKSTKTTQKAILTIDKTPPDLQIIDDYYLYLNNKGKGTVKTDSLIISAIDNCSNTTTNVTGQLDFDCSDVNPIFEKTLTITATDERNNSIQKTATIYVLDTLPPTLLVKDTILYLDTFGNAQISKNQMVIKYSDNCGEPSLSISKVYFDCSDIDTNFVLLSSTDIHGNTNTQTSIVCVRDTIKPVLEIEPATVYLDSFGVANISLSDILITLSDNCFIADTIISQTDFDCSDFGIKNISVTVYDADNNVVEKTTSVNILDTLMPKLSVIDTTLYLDSNGVANISADQIISSAWYNCQITDTIISKTQFTCSNAGIDTITVTIGNKNTNVYITKQAIITILDTITPTLITNNVSAFIDSAGFVVLDFSAIVNYAYDNCSISDFQIDSAYYDCSDIGQEHFATIALADESENSSKRTINITVLDTLAPTIELKDTILFLDDLSSASITLQELVISSYDNCGVSDITINKTEFDCSDTWQNNVIVSISDNYNNTTNVSPNIMVLDTIKPIVLCKKDTIITTANGLYTLQGTIFDATATDNCEYLELTNSLTNTHTIDNYLLTTGSYLVIWRATDAQSSSICTQTITINKATELDGILNNIKIYPNPANNFININFNNSNENNYKVNIYNLLGQEIFFKEYHPSNEISIDVKEFEDGIYFIKISSKDKIYTSKIIIQK